MAKKKEKDLTGTTIQMTDIQKDFLKNLMKHREFAEAAFEQTSEMLYEGKRAFWRTIFDFAPETKNYHCKYNVVTGEIKIISKMSKPRK